MKPIEQWRIYKPTYLGWLIFGTTPGISAPMSHVCAMNIITIMWLEDE